MKEERQSNLRERNNVGVVAITATSAKLPTRRVPVVPPPRVVAPRAPVLQSHFDQPSFKETQRLASVQTPQPRSVRVLTSAADSESYNNIRLKVKREADILTTQLEENAKIILAESKLVWAEAELEKRREEGRQKVIRAQTLTRIDEDG